MIEIGINKLHKNYGYNPVLMDFSLEVKTGDRLGLVGKNGTGKSTLLKIISGEETPDKGSVSIRRGSTLGYLEQIPTLPGDGGTVREELYKVFADVFKTEAEMKQLEQAMAGEPDTAKLEKLMEDYQNVQTRYLAMDGYSVEEKFGRIVTGFSLSELLDRPFHVLSGGQKTIVKLACTLLNEPDILLLDEPTNHLDVKTLEWFEGFLAKYSGTVLIISHDRYFLDKVTNKTAILERGACQVFHGNYSFSLKEKERLLLLEFEDYKNQQKKIAAMKAAIKRYRLWAAKGDNEAFYKKAKELEKRLEKMEILEKPQLEKPKIPLHFDGSRAGHDILTIKHLDFAFDCTRLFDDLELALFEKEKACLMGDNGTGKTTLLKIILEQLPGQPAEKLLGDLTEHEKHIKLAPSAKTGYIPQEIRFEDDGKNIFETFRYAYPCTEEYARRTLSRYFFFGDSIFKRVSSLSGGEKVLLKLCILIQQEVNFLILDEPTNHIDIETREMLEEALLDYNGTLLFISHDRYFISKIGTRMLTLSGGKIESFYGDYQTYTAYKQQQKGPA